MLKKKTKEKLSSVCTCWSIYEPSYLQKVYASYSVCSTVGPVASMSVNEFIDIIRSTVFQRNLCWGCATSKAITKADFSVHFTIFHCRMSTIQPAWPVCTASVCCHTRCWHFSSSSSHKTIPSRRELVVTRRWTIKGCFVTALSAGITQVFVIIAWIGYKVYDNCYRIVVNIIYLNLL